MSDLWRPRLLAGLWPDVHRGGGGYHCALFFSSRGCSFFFALPCIFLYFFDWPCSLSCLSRRRTRHNRTMPSRTSARRTQTGRAVSGAYAHTHTRNQEQNDPRDPGGAEREKQKRLSTSPPRAARPTSLALPIPTHLFFYFSTFFLSLFLLSAVLFLCRCSSLPLPVHQLYLCIPSLDHARARTPLGNV